MLLGSKIITYMYYMISYNVLDSIIWFCIPLRDKAKKTKN